MSLKISNSRISNVNIFTRKFNPIPVSWVQRSGAPAGSILSSVTFGNDKFVAVGYTASPQRCLILTSNDSITWDIQTPPASHTTGSSFYEEVIFANGVFIAIGYGGFIATSSDGITWTARTSGIFDSLQGITYGDGVFAIGSSNSNNMLSSGDNGVTWATHTTGVSGSAVYGGVYGLGHHIMGGYDGLILRSTNGSSWSQQKLGSVNYNSGLFDGTRVILVNGANSTGAISTDGSVFTSINLGFSSTTAAYENGIYMFGGSSGTLRVGDSLDALELADAGFSSITINDVAFGNRAFVAVGGDKISSCLI